MVMQQRTNYYQGINLHNLLRPVRITIATVKHELAVDVDCQPEAFMAQDCKSITTFMWVNLLIYEREFQAVGVWDVIPRVHNQIIRQKCKAFYSTKEQNKIWQNGIMSDLST